MAREAMTSDFESAALDGYIVVKFEKVRARWEETEP